MTQRDRLLSVYRGQVPEVVPFMLDLSHWWLHRHQLPWDLSQGRLEPETDLIAYHRAMGVGYYLPSLAAFYSTQHADGVTAEVEKHEGRAGPEITWCYHTSLGSIARTRLWEARTYSWRIAEWGVRSEDDLRVLALALAGRTFAPEWERYHAWRGAVGDTGVVYLSAGYSAVGALMNLWMGPTGLIFAAHDCPDLLRAVVRDINAANLRLVDLLAQSPAEIILLGDNLSTDLQPPSFFNQWSRDYYVEAIRRLHEAGKYVAFHIDGRLRGGLELLAAIGVDAADAVTPAPMGDLTAEACRAEAGPGMILSGGVAPNLWVTSAPREQFSAAVRAWLNLRRDSPRLIANAGDQVPPGAEEDRIQLMGELVREHGRY
jgi:hypothetical protein